MIWNFFNAAKVYKPSNTTWIFNSHEFLPHIGNDDREKVIQFWVEFYDEAIKKCEITNMNECVPMKNDFIYKQVIFKRLNHHRGMNLSEEELRDIQKFIEESTFEFDEESMYKTVPNVIIDMIKKGEQSATLGYSSAKDFLLLSKKLSDEEKESLNVFGNYTLEVLIIHVLSTLFNAVESNSVIRLSTLVDRLDTAVRSQITLLMRRKFHREWTPVVPEQPSAPKAKASDEAKTRAKTRSRYFSFGTELVKFMQKRDLIEVSHIGNIEDDPIRKKGGDFYIAKHQNVHCKFPVSDLPIRFSLPMVYKPEDWKSILPDNQKPKYLSDIRGGYLSSLTADIDERYRLLSSHNIDHFYLELNQNSDQLCNIMNKLQSEPFKVNSLFLKYIRDNESILVEHGLLLPSFLSKLKFKDIYEIFKNKYYSYNFKKGVRLATLFKELSQLIQRACYEQYILKLSIVYEGYRFYLPAFLDFRGRIYRSGILHFHERDLARSLVVFVEDAYGLDNQKDMNLLKSFVEASSFHYKGFTNYSNGLKWFADHISSSLNDNNTLIEKARDAKKPLQLLSCAVALNDVDERPPERGPDIFQDLIYYPITQDASASAYQLMSYFLLDKSLAQNTNLIAPDNDDNIQDLYEYLLEDMKVFIKETYKKDSLILTVGENLTRKIMKNIFMPMIYGKTIMSTAAYLQEALPLDLGKRSKTVAKVFYVFFEKKYDRLYCLMNLIKNIGWFSSERDLAVCYKVPLFTTIQDYRKSSETHIWVHDIKSSET
ncbi:putative DNA-directed RNA polymerase [Apium graveolens]|uniref:putative DNA-directed RNA polymerase n=1 Tax=Apium graveolens TaxID=4045 RepID=UPI003D79B8E6